jgi:hypothetical protein
MLSAASIAGWRRHLRQYRRKHVAGIGSMAAAQHRGGWHGGGAHLLRQHRQYQLLKGGAISVAARKASCGVATARQRGCLATAAAESENHENSKKTNLAASAW